MRAEEDFDANLAGEDSQSEQERASWFKRIKKGILTSTSEKKETPEGLWNKCPECNYICTAQDLKANLHVCPKCNYHHRIGSAEYYDIIFD
ncbi:MAG TPA: acetyl-CoA carboxylase carboxyl transferase subunit beta, partial [Parasegetibacter sp.]